MASASPAPRLPLRALNHISIVVADVEKVAAFYTDVLGFALIRRPHALEESFHGAWLHNYNLGLHLIKGNPLPRPHELNPKDDHISFQAENLADVEARLNESSLQYVKTVFDEDGCRVTQLFFHDPEHHMIEICNCDVLPVVHQPCLTCAGPQHLHQPAIEQEEQQVQLQEERLQEERLLMEKTHGHGAQQADKDFERSDSMDSSHSSHTAALDARLDARIRRCCSTSSVTSLPLLRTHTPALV